MRPSLDLKESMHPVSRAIKRKGSSLLVRTRSLGRKRSSSQLTRQSSSVSVGSLSRFNEEETRDEKETMRCSHEFNRSPPESPTVRHDADGTVHNGDYDESYLNSSDIHNDRSIHSLAPLEKNFITNTITRLQVLGYAEQNDLYSLSLLLRDVCAYAKPFEPQIQSDYEALHHHEQYQPQQKVLNINPLWTTLEHLLSKRCDNDDNVLDGPMTLALLKSSICGSLQDMNIKVVTDGDSDSNSMRNGSWGNPPFMNSWNSLSYCQCSLF